MRERGTRKQQMMAFLLLGIPPVILLTALLSVFLLWEPHSTSPGAKGVSIGELELNASGEQEGMEPQRREEILIANMTLEEKAAQLFMITPEVLTGVNQVSAAGEVTREAFFQYPVGGILYSQNNLQTKMQTESLLTDMQNISMERLGFPVFLGVEGEGENKVSIAGYGSFDMTELGFNLDLAMAVDPLAEEVEDGTDYVMVGHNTLKETISEGTPASLAGEIVTGVIREKLDFRGVIITDAMNQEAISGSYSSGEAAVQALLAGVDLILMPENFGEAYQEVLNAVADGILTEERIEESVRRILRLKSKISG